MTVNVQDQRAQRQRNLSIAFALAAYRSDHVTYAHKLNDLVPNYVSSLPNDIFSGTALKYRQSGKGYLLYSVGINGKDEGGHSYDDDPPGDDLAIHVPIPEPKPNR